VDEPPISKILIGMCCKWLHHATDSYLIVLQISLSWQCSFPLSLLGTASRVSMAQNKKAGRIH
jgi:hypothetical protein